MNNGCTFICCYSDSKEVVNLISKPINKFHCYASEIANIKNLMNLERELSLSHTLREGNVSADFLAKLGSSNVVKMKIWKSLPEGLETLLVSDSKRMLHPRP